MDEAEGGKIPSQEETWQELQNRLEAESNESFERCVDLNSLLYEKPIGDEQADKIRQVKVNEILFESPLDQLARDIRELHKLANQEVPKDKTGLVQAERQATASIASAVLSRRLIEELPDKK